MTSEAELSCSPDAVTSRCCRMTSELGCACGGPSGGLVRMCRRTAVSIEVIFLGRPFTVILGRRVTTAMTWLMLYRGRCNGGSATKLKVGREGHMGLLYRGRGGVCIRSSGTDALDLTGGGPGTVTSVPGSSNLSRGPSNNLHLIATDLPGVVR
jgi:hypothetical protein